MEIITIKEARDRNLTSLTMPYRLPDEKWMLDNVLRDMRRAAIRHAAVLTKNGCEVWREGMVLNEQHRYWKSGRHAPSRSVTLRHAP